MHAASDPPADLNDEARQLSRLRWRCRRGMRELDELLGRYLERAWADADASERAVFERLLTCEDTDLWVWLMGRADPPDDEALAGMVQIIGALPARNPSGQ